MPFSPRRVWVPVLLLSSLLLAESACSPPPDLHIAVMMPPLPGGATRNALQWAVQNVNAAGGIWGRTLVAEEVSIDPMADPTKQSQQASQVASDDRYVAVIGIGSSETLAATADLFVEHRKPVVSFNSAAADILRAYGGKGWIWRTRESDIGQAELLAYFAAKQGAQRISLVTSTSLSGQTFLSWFGFFARDLGYAADRIRIDVIEPASGCEAAMARALSPKPDMLFVAGSTPTDFECAVRYARRPEETSRPRIVFADTGLDVATILRSLGPLAEGIEGFAPVSPTDSAGRSFESAFLARFGHASPPHGASEYDAVLLLAAGLTQSRGEGGEALAQALRGVVQGRGERVTWDAEGIAQALAALRDGQEPNLSGATGELDFEPGLLTDLADSTMAHFTLRQGQRQYSERFFTGDARFRTSGQELVQNPVETAMDLAASSSPYQPTEPKREVWALIAALSSGWNNYRHQADALRQYWLLRKNGVPDDHIVLLLADDIAGARQNRRPGIIQNELAGPNLHAGAQRDYGLQLGATELMDVVQGNATAATPTVLQPSANSNLYVYLVGHGGERGIPVGASSAADGLSARGDLLSPSLLRQALCQLQGQGKLRRALIVVESCFGGVFGERQSDGLEAGCDGGVPLQGSVLLSSASSDENSLATSYDTDLSAWLADEFSQKLARFAEAQPNASVAEAFKSTYVAVPGSHVSIYNTANAGSLHQVALSEFLRP